MAKTKEEIVAYKVFDLLSDVRLDPHMIGFYLAHSSDPNIYDVLDEVIESTLLTREERQGRIKKMILGVENEHTL
jgi:hypothetical protein